VKPRDIFISHSSGDEAVARDLRGLLETAGYTCWMAPDDIVGTDTWTEQILDAIAGSRAMLVLVSSRANDSQHVSREVNLALGRQRAVLPIRIENVPPGGSLEYLLSLVQRVDAFPLPVSEHSSQILRRLGAILQEDETAPIPRPSPPPPAPPNPVPPSPAPPAPMPGPGAAGISLWLRRNPVAAGIAAAALAILILGGIVLGGGLGRSPAVSASPSDVAVSTPTVAPITPTPDPDAFPTEAERNLIAAIPGMASIETCARFERPAAYVAALAMIACPAPVGDAQYKVFYASFATRTALDKLYATFLSSIPRQGACTVGLPANNPWAPVKGDPNSGELGCYARDERVQYIWTHYRLRVLGSWLAPTREDGATFFWDDFVPATGP
jgi:hypothetical protein